MSYFALLNSLFFLPSIESSAAIKLENGPLPFYLKAFIQADRRLLEDELQEHILMKQTKHKEQVSLKSKMRSIYKRLPPAEESNSDTSSGTGKTHLLIQNSTTRGRSSNKGLVRNFTQGGQTFSYSERAIIKAVLE